MPAENRVWRKDGRPFQSSLSANGITLHSEQATLIVVQQQSLPAQLRQPVFSLSILELTDLFLPVVDHSTEARQQNVPGLEDEGHGYRRRSASVRCPQMKSSV